MTSEAAASWQRRVPHSNFWVKSRRRALKNSSFVSGHRFSDAVTSYKSDAPLGAEEKPSSKRESSRYFFVPIH